MVGRPKLERGVLSFTAFVGRGAGGVVCRPEIRVGNRHWQNPQDRPLPGPDTPPPENRRGQGLLYLLRTTAGAESLAGSPLQHRRLTPTGASARVPPTVLSRETGEGTMHSMVEGAATNASPGGSVSWPTATSDEAQATTLGRPCRKRLGPHPKHF